MNNFKMQDQGSTVSFCPSFSTYSSDRLSAVADRVIEEARRSPAGIASDRTDNSRDGTETTGGVAEKDSDDFEFVLTRADPDDFTGSTIGGDVFPVFNRDLWIEYQKDREDEKVAGIRLQLGKLFVDDQDPPSSSSSEADELEGITPGTYCVWTPCKSPSASPSPSPSPSPSRCSKSNSTGSSSRPKWRLRDLLHLRRSHSDGKESLFFFNSDHNNKHSGESNLKKTKEKTAAGSPARGGKAKERVSAHEVFYVRNKALKDGDKRKSYLPYRQGLVGFFSNVNGLGRTFPPF